MVTFDVSVSGETIGRRLADDMEEAVYALVALGEGIEGEAEEFVEWVQERSSREHEKTALKALAGLILKGCEE